MSNLKAPLRRLRERLAALAFASVWRHADRAPDVVIGEDATPYLRRWHVIPRNRFFNVYLHNFLRSDDDRALHDHPWANVSFVLQGSYFEHRIREGGIHVRTERRAGDIVLRRASAAHRIELPSPARGCWTLFLTGPCVRSWGFHCPAGWVHWRDFTNPADGGKTIGRGCGEAPFVLPKGG